MGKSQISLEFIILIGMGFIFFMGLLLVIYQLTSQKQSQSDYDLFYDLAKSIQQELITVSDAEPGLIVVYEIPPAEMNYTVDKHSYALTNTNNSITLSYDEGTVNLPAPALNGSLRIGSNTLRNIDGVVYIE